MANHNPSSRDFVAKPPLSLPPLPYRASPNQSARSSNNKPPFLIVIHRPVGSYHGSIDWLCNPKADASCHVITEGAGTGVDKTTQLVPWHMKAWHAASFNSVSYGIEVDDDAWDGDDLSAFFSAAHVAAWICHKTGIPPVWTKDPLNKPGLARHLDLGRAGGGHSDPTSDEVLWRNFLKQVASDVQRTGWRKTWGRGKLIPLGS